MAPTQIPNTVQQYIVKATAHPYSIPTDAVASFAFKNGFITSKEVGFIASVRRYAIHKRPTSGQLRWLKSINYRITTRKPAKKGEG